MGCLGAGGECSTSRAKYRKNWYSVAKSHLSNTGLHGSGDKTLKQFKCIFTVVSQTSTHSRDMCSFKGVNIAASTQMYGSYIPGKHPCGPRLQVMFKRPWAFTREHYGNSKKSHEFCKIGGGGNTHNLLDFNTCCSIQWHDLPSCFSMNTALPIPLPRRIITTLSLWIFTK